LNKNQFKWAFIVLSENFRYLPHQRNAAMAFDGVVGVVLKRVGIDILSAVQYLSI